MLLRTANSGDAAGILDIYSPYVEHTAVSFETQIPSLESFQTRMSAIQEDYPWLVVLDGDRVAGFSYASRHRYRTAYQWSVESSVYIHPDYRRRGLAARLYGELFAYLKKQGLVNVYAVITLPNPASESFHRSMGFQFIGTYVGIGYKLGAWHDVQWMGLVLQDHPDPPVPPIPFPELV